MMQRIVIFFTFIFLTVTAFAIDTGKAFDDPAMQARYEHLIAEIRCVTCQNQTIKDSNAFIAADLRREIRRLMEEGKDDDEIRRFCALSTALCWKNTCTVDRAISIGAIWRFRYFQSHPSPHDTVSR
jgi:hypothetical protein